MKKKAGCKDDGLVYSVSVSGGYGHDFHSIGGKSCRHGAS